MVHKSNQLVAKGVFAIAAVALVGATTATYAITNSTSNVTSGYGGSETAVQASNNFEADFAAYTAVFSQDVAALSAQAKSQLGATGDAQVDQFDARFAAGTSEMNESVAAASAKFRAEVTTAINSGESKDKFIDTFNRAKAEYLNSLDAAKNDFAAVLSNLGHSSNVTKDQFINGFNSSRDSYGNKLEGAKNTFADIVSNS